MHAVLLQLREASEVDRLCQQLETAAGPVTLKWSTSRSSPDTSTMDKLAGTWRLIYSSGFNGGSLGGSRPGPPAAFVPSILGQVYQVIDADKVRQPLGGALHPSCAGSCRESCGARMPDGHDSKSYPGMLGRVGVGAMAAGVADSGPPAAVGAAALLAAIVAASAEVWLHYHHYHYKHGNRALFLLLFMLLRLRARLAPCGSHYNYPSTARDAVLGTRMYKCTFKCQCVIKY